jgi:diguanylate cyclase (GGDEF)-like protein
MTISKTFLIGFLLAVTVLVANTLVSSAAIRKMFEATTSVTNSLHVVDALKDIQFNIANMQAAQRNYIVSGELAHLEKIRSLLADSRTPLEKLHGLRADALREKDIARLEAILDEQMSSFTALAELHRSNGFNPALRALRDSRPGVAMDRIQEVLARLEAGEDAVLAQRTQQSANNTNLSQITSFVAAGFNLALLCLIYYLAYREVRDRRLAEAVLVYTATHDPLTQLPNRRLFSERLQHALNLAQRHKRRLAVLFIDLDRFKNINDTLGHGAGDQILQDIGRRLGHCVRESDTIARQGGDEFVVLIEEFDEPQSVVAVAEKILAAVAIPLTLGRKEFHITASIGISTFPDDGDSLQALLKNADIAMYRAKEQGKNNYKFYAEQMNRHFHDRLAIEAGLRHALERGELELYYQPKVDTLTGHIHSMEALLRWEHPELGRVHPERFIPVAEETGLIVPIGEWVLRTACAQNRAWQNQGLPALRVAVNLSARQFGKPTLLQDIAQVLSETELDPRYLELEITESMVMHDAERAVQVLKDLKASGIYLAIDDFGTGYSSLAYLKRFPIDCVKVDRSFIRDIPADPDDMAITRTVIAMAHSLRLSVVAEGVETKEQVRFLRDHHCDEIQGHYFSPPLPAEQFAAFIREQQIAGRKKLTIVPTAAIA